MSVFWRPRGCVLWYDFAELSGDTVYDLSGNGNHGTIYNCEWRRGHLIGALYFNGENAYVEVLDSPSLNIDGAWTVEVWIKPYALPSDWHVIFRRVWNTDSNYAIYLYGNKARIYVSGLTPAYVESNATLEVGNWYHIVGVWNPTESKLYLYLNGSLELGNVVEVTGSPSVVAGNLRFGLDGWDQNFNGIIAFARIYNRALTEREIKAHYHYLIQGYIAHPPFI